MLDYVKCIIYDILCNFCNKFCELDIFICIFMDNKIKI